MQPQLIFLYFARDVSYSICWWEFSAAEINASLMEISVAVENISLKKNVIITTANAKLC